MRITVTIDDELFENAMKMAERGANRSELIREAIKTFIRVQAGKRLAALGGTMPSIKAVARRRHKPSGR